MSTDYSAVLTANYSTSQWTLDGDTYDGLVWLDSDPKPTQAELDAQWPAVDYQKQYDYVSQTRHNEYIAKSDPIFFEWQRGTKTQADWDAAVQAIKDANPYPPAPTKKK
jgi:hypothetical protein